MSLISTFFPRDDTTEAWYRAYSVYQSLENPSRLQWAKTKREYIFSSIAYSVGLANAWRFAYVAYTCGRGGFLLPFLILTITVGIPLLVFESFLGQFTACSPVSAFNFSMLSRGVGVSMGLVSWLMSIYSIMFIVYPIKYLFLTLESDLPWTVCPPDHNYTCVSIADYSKFNHSVCGKMLSDYMCPETAANVFWEDKVLSSEKGVTSAIFGFINWDKFILLAFAWGLIFLCTVSGLRGTSRVSSVSIVYPACILVILLIMMAIQEGASMGLEYFFIPDLAKISDPKIWTEAGSQVILTFGLCTGGQVLLSSYNKFDNSVHKQIWVIALTTFLYTLLNAVTVFSVIGHLSHIMKVPVDELFDDSILGLNLMVFMEDLGRGTAANLACILFLVKEILLTLTAQMSFLNVVTSVIHEEIDRLKDHYSKIRLVICLVSFLIGIEFTSQGGIYLVQFMRVYVPHISLSGIGLAQIVFLGCCYGVTRFFLDVNFMLSITIPAPFAAVWLLLCPVILLMLFVANMYDLFTSNFYGYPPTIRAIGCVISFLTLLPIPVGVVYGIVRCARQGFWKNSLYPHPNWGPRDTVIKILYINWLRHKEPGIEITELDDTLDELGSPKNLLDVRAAMLAHMRKDILLSRIGDLLRFDQTRSTPSLRETHV